MRTLLAILALSLLPLAANAQWVGGVGYYNISDEEGSIDVSLGVIVGSIGYEFKTEGDFTFMPELRLGVGIGDDTVLGVDVELDSLYALSFRGQFDFESGMYLFAAPAYANIKVTAAAGGFSASEDDGEFGVGGGIGFNFSERTRGEISYETYDGTDVFGIAWKMLFQ